MDYQAIVDGFSSMACIISVEKNPDGNQRKYRILTGNKKYIESIEHPAPGTEMLSNSFIPNAEYTTYLNRDLNFEDYCYQAAIEMKCLHSYVHPERMDLWFNMSFLPLESDDEKLGYCIYIMEISREASSERMSNMSTEIATSVLDTCIRLRGTNDFKATMKNVIQGIGDLCVAEHCCILVMNEMDRTCYVLGEALSEGTKLLPMDTYVNKDFYDIAESWISTIAGSNCLIAKDEHDMLIIKERNPVWYESLTGAGAHNIVLFPLKSGNRLLGFMWAINFDASRSIKIKETLEVTTFILGSELGNHLLLDRLKMLSSKDMLTGVMNRNEMNNYVEMLSRGEKNAGSSVAVLFSDLNGLKRINDSKGHSAGDRLLVNAAKVLREVFDEKEIFRAGGDEFTVIALDISTEELHKRMEKIREGCMAYPGLAFALGGCYEKECRNIRMALRIADERMYEDKRRFYEEHPEIPISGKREYMEKEQAAADDTGGPDDIDRDYLTGLLSMNSFLRIAEQGRRTMHEKEIETALVFLNLSGLKFFNKKYGFSEGNALIREMADILAALFGKDRCSRFGQDHFAVFTEKEGLENKLKTVFKEMKRANNGKTLYVRAGVYPDSMGIVETSLACDRAKYACDLNKDDNNSYYRFFDHNMLQMEVNRQYVIDHLDQAINENWIKAFYQPIVRATTLKVCDEEALARWIDPERGMLSPAEFIPILEDSKLIYKVDLRMVDIILEKMRNQRRAGLHVVPISVNLSRTDFDVCDMVEEICNRVDAAGIARELLTIEITESVIGADFDFMKEQIDRFQKLGFRVWMDDFGSGYSSLDLLQEIHFDLIKFDMRFMRQFDRKPESRVILTELMRMAASLNVERVAEGVETRAQVEFLSEIGCTKLQGFYFCKPIPLAEIIERNKKGIQIGFENPAEIDYNRTVSAINLYDLGAVSSGDVRSVRQYFNTQPMFVVEYDGANVTLVRENRSYREFVDQHEGLLRMHQTIAISDTDNEYSLALYKGLLRSEEEGRTVFINETIGNGDVIHAMVRKVMKNPVTGVTSYAFAVLGITRVESKGLSFSNVARALSTNYINLYYVDLETEEFTEYSPYRNKEEISAERNGIHFFDAVREDAPAALYSEDLDAFLTAFTKKNVKTALRKYGAFNYTYRLMIDGKPQYVSMKAVCMEKEDNRIIIGINNVDAGVRQRETIERLKAETATYNRISVLMGDFVFIYTVDPETCRYLEYSCASEYAELGIPTEGEDFFRDSIRESIDRIHEDDLEFFLKEFTKENVMDKTKNGEIFTLEYRIRLRNIMEKVALRAGIVEEKDGPQLIVGVNRKSRA